MDLSTAEKLAKEWVAAWNAHDLEAILSHYASDVIFTSPFVVKILGEPTGTIQGIEKLRDYFAKGLPAYPDLNFKPLKVLAGMNSFVIYYESVGGRLCAEFMELNPQGKVIRVFAHYHPL